MNPTLPTVLGKDPVTGTAVKKHGPNCSGGAALSTSTCQENVEFQRGHRQSRRLPNRLPHPYEVIGEQLLGGGDDVSRRAFQHDGARQTCRKHYERSQPGRHPHILFRHRTTEPSLRRSGSIRRARRAPAEALLRPTVRTRLARQSHKPVRTTSDNKTITNSCADWGVHDSRADQHSHRPVSQLIAAPQYRRRHWLAFAVLRQRKNSGLEDP